MAFEDLYGRSETIVDEVALRRRAKADFQVDRLPRAAEVVDALVASAAAAFRDAGAAPTPVVRSLGRGRGPLGHARYRYERVLEGWPVAEWLVGTDERLYRRPDGPFRVTRPKDVSVGHRLEVEHARGLLKLGLRPGTRVLLVNHLDPAGALTEVDLAVDLTAVRRAEEIPAPLTDFLLTPGDEVLVLRSRGTKREYRPFEDLLDEALDTRGR
ncbi:hypothetical protein [Actinokineospora bangkokensis]|uniref:RCK C-terminal domain-containing protein n=1 Tax=Actinokineospora bangkokensis TaxID=1193682 RepID=A0A1Q9LTL5_9PSEU|nr:hypothetical protein [Actinokineospora bangkokensis]OLR95376.1 hypothetical protein BJP25_06365 [Actinokineospora bangkokensis]